MEFDKTRVYTAVNAEELPIGSRCIFADTMKELEDAVNDKQSACICKLKRITERCSMFRFVCENHSAHNLAYLLKEPQYKPFSNTEKALEAIRKHGGWVKDKYSGYLVFITGIDIGARNGDEIQIGKYWHTASHLFNVFVFADDGTPCGELVEE